MQTYKDDILGFSISYPDHWAVVPAAWAKQFMNRAAGTSEKLAEYLSRSKEPFLIAQDPSASPDVAIPAVKCQAYNPAAISAAGGISAVLALIAKQSQQAFPDFEVNEYLPECVVAGVKGAKMVVSMSVKNPEGESFHGKSEFYLLPTQVAVFLVAVTATSNPDFRPEQELAGILRSIRIEHA